MSGYEFARSVEAEAYVRLKPFLQAHSETGYVLVEKSPLARALQETVGDILFNHKKMGRLISVELKAERKHTGNFFLESWSNLNIKDAGSWEQRGSNPGWLLKIHPTLIFYYFLDVDRLYIIRAHRLARWAFATPAKGNCIGATRVHDFRTVVQSKYDQLNDTHGHLVPVDVIRDEVGFQLVFPRQIELWPEVAA